MIETLIEAQALTRIYSIARGPFLKPAQLTALDSVSFALAAQKTLAVVGESGSGKSTLARLVTMIERPSAGALAIAGEDALAPRARKRLRREVQMVFQDPYGSLNPRRRVGAIIEEPLIANTDSGAAARRAKVEALMAKVGLRPDQFERYPHMFSGGQRQRVAIARALVLNPKLVVADEPVSALDVSVRAQVLNLMADLQAEFRLAYLFISHDLSVVRHIADDVLVLYLGRTVEQGAKSRIFDSPRHPYTRALLAATPSVDPERRQVRQVLRGEMPSPLAPPAGCAFHSRCPHAIARCREERPPLRTIDGRSVACHRAEEI